jgi:hypothetical protein
VPSDPLIAAFIDTLARSATIIPDHLAHLFAANDA